jgi:2'-5' RNA ligase
MIRSFIAIDISQEIQINIHNLIAKLKKETQCPIGWVNARNVHITLKFLGDIYQEDVQGIRRAINDISKTKKAFQILIGGLGVFPNLKRPRVIWIGCQFDDSGMDLQRSIEMALQNEGYETEKRKFHPHLTIGRVRNNASNKDLQAFANLYDRYKNSDMGGMQAMKFHLYRSDLLPRGAKYTVLHTFTLGDS